MIYFFAMKIGLLSVALVCSHVSGADLRLGYVGTDTSHVITFMRYFNDPTFKDYIPGARVVAAYKGGSKDLQRSYERVDVFAEQLQRD